MWDFNRLQNTAKEEIAAATDMKTLEALRVKYLGRKGLIADIYGSLPDAVPAQKPAIGKGANELKNLVAGLLDEKKLLLEQAQNVQGDALQALDVTAPGVAPAIGRSHILTQTINDICGTFEQLGFTVMEGPEVETEFHNFTGLNIPIDHPSRDAFDTFYLDKHDPDKKDRYLLLRSHTSPMQVRVMKKHKPPLAIVVPGKVFRPDAVDASHSFMFHQIEGFLVDEGIKFSDLKGLLTVFCQRLFGENTKMRFRPHFFPFTEPSAEVDISCYICGGKGCSVCARKGWLEIMGCGMINPKVFEAVGYPKGKYTGLAFGMGVERMAMLKHGIHDIRLFFENDVRFLSQF